MKIKNITILALALMVATSTIGFFAVGGSKGFASEGKGARALEGSWKVRLTPTSGMPQFDEFMTFAAGGGIVESNNFPFHLFPPAGLVAGPGHGSWQYAGAQQFPFTFIKFLYTPQGQAAGTLKVTGTITYSRADDTWSGPASVAVCDSQANNCNTIDVTNGTAVRISAGG